MKGFLSFLLLGSLLLAGYLLLWPVPIEPAAWSPPANPGWTGVYAQNQQLAGVQRRRLGGPHGSPTRV